MKRSSTFIYGALSLVVAGSAAVAFASAAAASATATSSRRSSQSLTLRSTAGRRPAR
jgi:hypothetical protein